MRHSSHVVRLYYHLLINHKVNILDTKLLVHSATGFDNYNYSHPQVVTLVDILFRDLIYGQLQSHYRRMGHCFKINNIIKIWLESRLKLELEPTLLLRLTFSSTLWYLALFIWLQC
jgi:hypothetical protein